MPTNKFFKCPYCDKRLSRESLIGHIERNHLDQLPDGFTPLRMAFHVVNRRPVEYRRSCKVCGKPCSWDEKKGRYNQLCDNPQCHDKWVKKMKSDMGKKYGAYRPTSTAEGLKKMLASRKISGKYKFQDGGEFVYTGSYERKALEFMDLVMDIKSEDLQIPAPTIKYPLKGKEHIYIPDIYYKPYNLIIEIKDGGQNPNKNESYSGTRERQMAKEKYVIEKTTYNYLRLTDNDFSQLLSVFADLKLALVENDDKRIVHVNENMFSAIHGMMPHTSGNDLVVINYNLNNDFNPTDYAISDSPLFNHIIYRDKYGMLKQSDDRKVLNGNYKTYLIKDALSKYHHISESLNKFVSKQFIYESVFNHPYYSYDQINFESSVQEYEDVYKSIENINESLLEYINASEEDLNG